GIATCGATTAAVASASFARAGAASPSAHTSAAMSTPPSPTRSMAPTLAHAAPRARGALGLEIFGQYCPALVIAPAPGNLQVALRKPLQCKSEPLDQSSRSLVAGLDVRFHAVQLELAERIRQRELDAFSHVASSVERRERVVAHERALKEPAHDVADV